MTRSTRHKPRQQNNLGPETKLTENYRDLHLMAFLYHKFTRKILISLILFWGLANFWLINPLLVVTVAITAIGVLCLFYTWYEVSPIFILIYLAFTSSYAFYGLLFQYSAPLWLVMIAIMVIFGYLFTYTEQKIGILGNKRLIYLILFSLVILQVFLALSYFLINPLSQSLLIATVCYLFIGFSYTILAKRHDANLTSYLWLAGAVIIAVLLTSTRRF